MFSPPVCTRQNTVAAPPSWRLSRACLALALIVFSFPAFCQVVFLSPHIQHSPVFQVLAGTDVEIQVLVEEGAGRIASGYLLWRLPGGEFRTNDLQPIPGGLGYIISGGDVHPPYLEYAIILRLDDDSQITFPLNQALVNPQRVAILQDQEATPEGPVLVVLYPGEGGVVPETEVHVAVSIFDPDSVLDLSSLQVFVDGGRVTPQDLSPNFLFLILENLSSGRHEVVIRFRHLDGYYLPDVSWSFNVARAEEEHGPNTLNWSFSGEARWEDFGGEDEGILRGDWRAEGLLRGWEYNARCYLTSEEAWDRQPQNRYLVGLRNRRWSFELGDATPLFADLMLSGLRVRGAELGYHGDRFHLLSVFGEVNKPVEGSTYRRFLGSIRPYWITASGARLGLCLLKAKDDLASVNESAASPQDNIVLGVDARIPMWSHKLSWTVATAISLTALDIRGGSLSPSGLKDADIDIPFDPRPLEPILVINESLSPPDPRGLGSLAYTTTLNLSHYGQNFSLGYRHVGPAYYSLGNPYLQNDLAGWNFSDQFSLFKNRVFFNLGLTRLHDNLKDDKITTTNTLGGWASLALYPPPPAPQIILTVNVSRAANDLATVDTLFSQLGSEGDTLYSDQRREDLSATINVSLNQSLHWLDRHHVLTLLTNLSRYQDLIEERLAGYPTISSNSRNYGATWRTQFSPLHSATLEYSYYSSETAALDYRYNQFGASYGGRFLQRKLGVVLGADRRLGDADLSRYHASLSADWEFYPKHALRILGHHYFNDSIQDEGLYRLYYVKRF